MEIYLEEGQALNSGAIKKLTEAAQILMRREVEDEDRAELSLTIVDP